MEIINIILMGGVFLSCIFAFSIILLPSKPYKFTEIFLISKVKNLIDENILNNLPFLSIIIPARNEAEVLPHTFPSILNQQYPNDKIEIILVNDNSTDNTKEIALEIKEKFSLKDNVKIIDGKKLEKGWVGKMWALHQGVKEAKGEWILFTDADIVYPENFIKYLIGYAIYKKCDMLSLMVKLRVGNFWEKLIIPAFLYFFKLLYPFKKVNNPKSSTSAAAGGCILIKSKVLKDIGGIEAIKSAIIDDITLATRVKNKGYNILLYDCPDLICKRGYKTLNQLWKMVSRTAFTELKYSYLRLLGCVIIMSIFFISPIIGITYPLLIFLILKKFAINPLIIFILSILSFIFMSFSYFFTIKYFKLSFFYTFSLPFVGVLYLLMTLDSAFQYTFGIRSQWKGRKYSNI